MQTTFNQSIARQNSEFPNLSLIKASAGSGKTHELTKRIIYYLLNQNIPHQELTNLLAITFNYHAEKEIKKRILKWLKDLYFEDKTAMNQMRELLDIPAEIIRDNAGNLLEYILSNYSDLQVRTIDSFLTSLFKASAIDLGYSPEFQITLEFKDLMNRAFSIQLNKIREGTPQAYELIEISRKTVESKKSDGAYIWDPANKLLEIIIKLHKKQVHLTGQFINYDNPKELENIKQEILNYYQEIESILNKSGIQPFGKRSYKDILQPDLSRNDFSRILTCGVDYKNPPFNKAPKGKELDYSEIVKLWNKLERAIAVYRAYHSRTYFNPFIKTYRDIILPYFKKISREEQIIYLADITKALNKYIQDEIVPDIYFRLGDRIYHYFIDEFQDTSPIQWNNLIPLMENSLAQGGSVLLVGDIKQAIYGFRHADYKIMQQMVNSTNPPFQSLSNNNYHQYELPYNHRTYQEIIDFTSKIFTENLKLDEKYSYAGELTGLLNYHQEARADFAGKGYVQYDLFYKNALADIDIGNESERGESAVKKKLLEIIEDLTQRGYRYSDITILSYENEDVVKLSGWLNESDMPFISYSGLNVRIRKITGEIISLLQFLNSPLDDLSFSIFLLGDILKKMLELAEHKFNGNEFLFQIRHKSKLDNISKPIYKLFQEKYPDLWRDYFDDLFVSVGYFPLYDLIMKLYRQFNLYINFPEEDAALNKLLEIIKEFEGAGKNDLNEFLEFAKLKSDEQIGWDIDAPSGINAIQLMTVHKAKGLGFPIVIFYITAQTIHYPDIYYQEKENKIQCLKINKEHTVFNEELESLYKIGIEDEKIKLLNTFYVGLTRAQFELYLLGLVKKSKSTPPFPFNLLPPESVIFGKKCNNPLKEERNNIIIAPKYLNFLPIKFIPEDKPEFYNENQYRGELIHKILAQIEFITTDLDNQLYSITNKIKLKSGKSVPADILIKIREFLSLDLIKNYFQPNQIIFREKEFIDKTGRKYRMDRIIMHNEEIILIDFKTGMEKKYQNTHSQQIQHYLSILKDIYPDKTIKSILAYVDIMEIREIKE